MKVKLPHGSVLGDAVVVNFISLSVIISIFFFQLKKQLYQRHCCSTELNHGTEFRKYTLGQVSPVYYLVVSFLKSAEQRH